jgi:hypothetical protein
LHVRRLPSKLKSAKPPRPAGGDSGASDTAGSRFLEFFAAAICNKNTRQAYYSAVTKYFVWCDHSKIGPPVDIEPLHVAAYKVAEKS